MQAVCHYLESFSEMLHNSLSYCRSLLQGEVESFVEILLLPPGWLFLLVIPVCIMMLVETGDRMRSHPIDVHPWPPDTPLFVDLPDLFVQMLKFPLHVFSISEMGVRFFLIEADILGRLDHSAEGDCVWDIMSEELAMLINVRNEIFHLPDDISIWLTITQIVDSHADNQVAWFRIVLVASSPGSATISDPASHYHFTVEVKISLEGGMLPEAGQCGG